MNMVHFDCMLFDYTVKVIRSRKW